MQVRGEPPHRGSSANGQEVPHLRHDGGVHLAPVRQQMAREPVDKTEVLAREDVALARRERISRRFAAEAARDKRPTTRQVGNGEGLVQVACVLLEG